ncbi:hypothetical protein FRC09_015931, partial [Ceratobasidium sp. 395]
MSTHHLDRYNGWLPSNHIVYNAFVEQLWDRAIKVSPELSIPAGHAESVQKFGEAIEGNPVMLDLFNKTLAQATQPKDRRIDNLEGFLRLLDHIVSGPPKFQVVEGVVSEPIGVPMYLVFDILSNTAAAHHLFCMPDFNKALKNLLNSWGEYLKDPKANSKSSLNEKPGGWFSPAAIAMLEVGRGTFNQTYYVPDPNAPDRGYKSWDDFFTRKILADARPLELLPGYDKDKIIFNGCESTVERWRSGVKAHDRFWLKGMPYSLYDMLHPKQHAYIDKFVGGTAFQAFLSPQDYHRWHSPITGEVISAEIVEGTYYAVLPDKGVYDDEEEIDPRGALIRSQPWLTANATRAVFVIKPKNPWMDYVCFIGVGMAEVSSCDITAHAGDNVDAGQELGMFHFGGSSYV